LNTSARNSRLCAAPKEIISAKVTSSRPPSSKVALARLPTGNRTRVPRRARTLCGMAEDFNGKISTDDVTFVPDQLQGNGDPRTLAARIYTLTLD